jgi:hypothetical protein
MSLLEQLVRDKMFHHPLPWSIDYDWMVEVYDASGRIVLKVQKDVEAHQLVSIATTITAEDAEFTAEFERMIDGT